MIKNPNCVTSFIPFKRFVLPIPPKKTRLYSFFPLLVGATLVLLHGLLPFYGKSGDALAKTPAAMIEDLQKRSAKIEEREKELDTREARLQLLKGEVEAMLKKYILLKEEIDQNNSEEQMKRRKREEERIIRLAKIYQSMPPKQAADRIGKMKESTALDLLRKIKEKVAAKILSNMNPTKATQFSEEFINAKK